MKKKIIIIVIICLILLVAVITATPLGTMLYLGSRIKGKISVTVNGENIDFSKCSFIFSDKGEAKANGNSANIYMKGGEYGTYRFSFTSEELDFPVTIKIYQWNWHQITDFSCNIAFERENGSFNGYYEGTLSFTQENIKKQAHDFSGNLDDFINGVEISIG